MRAYSLVLYKSENTRDARGEDTVSDDHGSAKHGGKQQKVLGKVAIL